MGTHKEVPLKLMEGFYIDTVLIGKQMALINFSLVVEKSTQRKYAEYSNRSLIDVAPSFDSVINFEKKKITP